MRTPMRPVSLEDKYLLEGQPVFLSGAQTIVRLALDQKRRDVDARLNTAGYVSGYRGSPLGGVDTAFWNASSVLNAHDIHFEPGLNEEIAATAVSGSQQVASFDSPYDGAFGIWYGKNPGVDRAADALKHANAIGTAKHGGVLAIAGDDPGAASSSLPNQCDHAFIAALIPILSPSSLEEVIEFGLTGFALSRYTGLWVGLKTVSDTIECTRSILTPVRTSRCVTPNDFELPSGGLNIRWPDDRWSQDERLLKWRLPAAHAFARVNGIDRFTFGDKGRRVTIVTSGKAYVDVRQALDELGIDEQLANALGIAVYKIGMVWPLETERTRDAIEGAEEVVVVEERRGVIEPQLKDMTYNWPANRRPVIVGKRDEAMRVLFPENGELSPTLVACVLGARLERLGLPQRVIERLRSIERRRDDAGLFAPLVTRVPHFCAGCPHARSTQVPEGSIALAGIGCHSLRVWMPESRTMILPQMGGEGASWFGIAPFTSTNHVFQNLGDGTYVHSGSLAIRAAVAARCNITFRILYNQATAMTGGQKIEGNPGVSEIVRQVLAEGASRVAVIADESRRYQSDIATIPGVSTHHRRDLDLVQRELRATPGVTIIVYDQMCATEKRRLAKRGKTPAPRVRPFINERVCEGCGDCGAYSNCAAILPLDTPIGRKRRIDQSSCNVDLSCIEGFCPSFVTVEGQQLQGTARLPNIDEPMQEPAIAQPLANIVATGVGGTGVMTIGAVAGMAAHIIDVGCTVLDNTGMARKGGAVSSHIRISAAGDQLHGSRIPDGRATLLLACDMIAATAAEILAKIERGRTFVIANANTTPTFIQRLDPDDRFNPSPLLERLQAAAGAERCDAIPASEMAEEMLGDSIYANMLMFGYAFQKGLAPLSTEAIDRAIALNGTAVDANRLAFKIGRRAAIERGISHTDDRGGGEADNLDALIETHATFLCEYQDQRYAQRYRDVVARAREADQAGGGGRREEFAMTVASTLFRLMAIKDEYEIGRLYTDGEFERSLARRFSGDYKVRYHFAPPLLAWPGKDGRIRKWTFGPWIRPVLKTLAAMRRLRGTRFDGFGWTTERRLERKLVLDYESLVSRLARDLTPDNRRVAVEAASLYGTIRGFGHVKRATIDKAKLREAELMAAFDDLVASKANRRSPG